MSKPLLIRPYYLNDIKKYIQNHSIFLEKNEFITLA